MGENGAMWYVLRTKPRGEKKLQALLQAWRVWNVLPTYVKVRRASRHIIKTDMPLFPCYLLARLDAAERLRVLKTNMTVAILPLPDARRVLRDVHQAVRATKATEDFRLVAPTRAGDAVRIVQGPMKGLSGRVKVVEGKTLLTVNIEAFGSAIEVQVAPEDCIAA
ncbi:MAG: hypothetical protein IJJ51_00270 [Kiritimatiellae bacterium]|nr:hypothetical protein [Kiritimatiellia bacterium]MBR4604492.1 hypothetical protein [Kiritimatiellia bacterium]